MENLTPQPEAGETFAPKTLTIEAIYQDKIFEASFLREPHWMKDGHRFSYVDTAPGSGMNTIWIYDVRSGLKMAVIDAQQLTLPKAEAAKVAANPNDDDSEEGDDSASAGADNALKINGYQWSADETQILFAHIPHRRSAHGDTSINVYSLATNALNRVRHSKHEMRNVKFSPDGKAIGYVRQDDLYILELATGKEIRLTNTATPTIYNGRFGWVYEEELDLADGWAWSPDGKHIGYFQIDETQVPQINLTNYDDLHLKPVETRYPKAGDPNPVVKIGVVDVPHFISGDVPVPPTRWMDIAAFKDVDPGVDIYISRLQWTPHNELLLQRIPRLQNRLDLLKVDPGTGKASVILSETDDRWVDARGDITFVEGTNQFLWTSDRSGYMHLYLYDLSGTMLRQLTQGDWDVTALAGVDSAHRMAYFTAARPNPLERQLFSVLLDGGGDIMQLSEGAGTHSPLFSPDGTHYLDTYSGRGVPPKITLHRASGHAVAVVHSNPMPKLAGHTLPDWEFTTFKTSDGVELYAMLLKPADFDPNKKYPVLMHTYGGPGSQVVTDTYGNGSGLERLLAQKGFIFAMVDGRGSGARGRDFMKITYQNLGHWEVNDQIEGAKWLGSLPYVDAKRIGIWGWSYGGYMASLCILRGADVFKTAVGVAPVTHWEFYDSIYTERYMRTPKENPKGYKESAALTDADKLKGNFLLMHGTADDNVHFQNSCRLAAEFQKHNKQFHAMYYPGKHHGMEGVSMHVFTLITSFFSQYL